MNAQPCTRVALLGIGGNVSQGILKALRRSSLNTWVVGTDLDPHQMGLYVCDAAYVLPHAKTEEFHDRLEDLCRRHEIHIILTGSEAILDSIVHRIHEIEKRTGAVFPAMAASTYFTVRDKWDLKQWMNTHGFPTPRAALTNHPQALRALAAEVSYPLIAKPRRGGGSRGIFMIEDEEDLAYALRRPDYVVEEYLDNNSAEYTVGCVCNKRGVLEEMIILRRHIFSGTTYRAWVEDREDIRTITARMLATLQPVGPINLQYRMRGDEPVCFEINPRFSGSVPVRAALGFNDVEAVVRHWLFDEPIRLPRVRHGEALRYWNEFYPSMHALEALNREGKYTPAESPPHGYAEHFGAQV